MRIAVLGPVEVHIGGEPVQMGPSLRRLLVALVVHRDTVLEPERLVDLVWAGDPPSGATTTLRSHVARLRAALGDAGDALAFRQSGYVFGVDDGALDAVCFSSEVDRAADALRVAEPEVALDAVEQALGRWHGRPFSGFDDDWIEPLRARLEERHAEALELQVEALLGLGRNDAAIAAAQSLSRDLPLREHPRALLMRALSAAGRSAEAIRVYADYRSYLGDETGLDPSAELSELEGRIVRGELRDAAEFGRVRGYALGPRLGQGAFSVVHSAVQPSVGRDVAVKIIRPQLADRPEFVRRFEHEAQLVASIEHPFVVPLYDFWREPGAAYLVMRLMRGGSVADAVHSQGAMSTAQVVRLLAQVGGAIEASHRAGVVHGDVRPANLLRDDDGHTYLADFGIAAPIDVELRRTIRYAAPETLRGERPGVAADILGLGATVFELLTGRVPYDDSDGRPDLVRRILAEPLPPVRATRPDLAEHVDEVLARATSKASADRYHDVTELVHDLSEALRRGSTPRRATPVVNPYVGLHTFTEADAARFHGREQLVATMLETAGRLPFVTLVGPSGSGKSSVVAAGVLPAIRSGALPGSSSWFVTTMQPGPDPIESFEAALLRVAVNAPASLREQLTEPGGLLRSVRRVLPNDDTTVLVVIDQFEELFTLADDEAQHRFLTELARAVTAPRSPLRIIATLRADHFDGPMRHPDLAGLVTDGTVTMRPMRPDELERAITLPAQAVGVDVEPALVAELVGRTTDHPASLPLLQFALTEVFDRRIAAVMLLENYHTIGGLTGALTARADRIVDDDDGPHEAAARRIFGRLVVPGASADDDVRRRAPRSAFGDDERTTWLIDQFVTARLLVVDRDETTREPTLEIAHEALLRDWPRLRAWVDDDRDDLRLHRRISDASHEWHTADNDPGLLARGARLELATELLHRRPDLFNTAETTWINQSITAADVARLAEQERTDAERRQHQRTRHLLAVVASLLVLTALAGGVALVLRQRALASEEQADVDRLVAVAGREGAERIDRGILLALEAHRRAPGFATATAVHRALSVEPRLASLRRVPVQAGWPAPVSADGATVLAFGRQDDEDVAMFVSTTTGETVGDVIRLEEPVNRAFLAGDGSLGAFDLSGGSLLFVTPDGSTYPSNEWVGAWELEFDAAADRAVALVDASPTGDFSDSEIVVLDAQTGEVTQRTPVAIDVSRGRMALSPDGERVAVFEAPQPGDPSTRLLVFDLDDDRLRAETLLTGGEPEVIAYTADGRVAVGHADGSIDIFTVADDLGSIEPAATLTGHTDMIVGFAANAAGDIASWSLDGTIRLWSPGERVSDPPIRWAAGFLSGLAVDDDRTITVSVLDRPIARFTDTPDIMRVDRYDVDGIPFLTEDQRSFVEIDPDGRRYVLHDVVTGDATTEIDVSHWSDPPAPIAFSSSDGAWWLGVKVATGEALIWNADGSVWNERLTSDVAAELGLDEIGASFISLRPGRSGDRIWALLPNTDGSGTAGWLSWPELEVLAGPVELSGIGPSWELADGSMMVAGAGAREISIVTSGAEPEVVTMPNPAGLAARAADPRTGTIYMAGDRGDIGAFDVDERSVRMLASIGGFTYDLALSPDGGRLAAVTDAGVQVIDTRSGALVGGPTPTDLSGYTSNPSVVWAGDGSGVWVAAGNSMTLVTADPEQWIDIACDIVGRDLDATEWQTFVQADTEPVSACDGVG